MDVLTDEQKLVFIARFMYDLAGEITEGVSIRHYRHPDVSGFYVELSFTYDAANVDCTFCRDYLCEYGADRKTLVRDILASWDNALNTMSRTVLSMRAQKINEAP